MLAGVDDGFPDAVVGTDGQADVAILLNCSQARTARKTMVHRLVWAGLAARKECQAVGVKHAKRPSFELLSRSLDELLLGPVVARAKASALRSSERNS